MFQIVAIFLAGITALKKKGLRLIGGGSFDLLCAGITALKKKGLRRHQVHVVDDVLLAGITALKKKGLRQPGST